MATSSTELYLIEASMKIGGICEMASWATAEFAEYLDAHGLTVANLSIAQLVDLCREFEDRICARCAAGEPVRDVPAFLKKQAD